jgi:hypothetical protein
MKRLNQHAMEAGTPARRKPARPGGCREGKKRTQLVFRSFGCARPVPHGWHSGTKNELRPVCFFSLIVFQAAQLLYGRGKVLAATAAFREVLGRDPDHLGALKWLACLLQNKRLRAGARVFC